MHAFKTLVLVLIILMAGNASAQFLGQMTPASVVNEGTGKAGGYFISAEDAFAVVGSMRYGFNEYTEGRFRFGFIDEEGKNTDPHVILGIDGKFLLWKYIESPGQETGSSAAQYDNPFNLSVGAALEYAKLNRSSVLGVGGSVIASLPFRFKNNSAIEPYAAFNLRYQHNKADDYIDDLGNRHDGSSESDFEIGLNLGALFSVTQLVDFTAEFQLADYQNAFMFGIDIAAF